MHRGEPLELLVGFFAHVGGKPGLFDGLGDVFQFLVGVGAVAQFLADGLELFAQVIFLLRLVHAFAGRGLDLDLHGRHFGLMHQMRDDEAQAIHRIDALEDFLRFLHLEPQVGGDEIGKASGFVHIAEDAHDVPGGDAAQGQDTLALFAREADKRFLFRFGRDGFRLGHKLNIGGQVGAALVQVDEAGARYPLHQRLDAPVGHLEQTQDERHGADRVEIVRFGVVHLPVFLGAEENMATVRRGGFHGLHGLFAPHEQGHDHIVEDHHVPEGKQGHGGWDFLQFRRNVFRGIHLLVLYLGGDTAPGRPPPTAGGSFLFLFVVVVIRIKRHGCILKR